jgi:hypothetical protein
MYSEDVFMRTELIDLEPRMLPPSLDQCVSAPTSTRADFRADFVVPPLAVAALLAAWDDDDDSTISAF